MTYEARMEGASQPIEADDLQDALEQAEEWVRDGDWDVSGGTIWVHAYLTVIDDDGEISGHRITAQIDPESPLCDDGQEHDWQAPYSIVGGIKENPGVWGHGGGVMITEVCMICGCERVTDTWAQDPETGEQGLDSVQYEGSKYADEVQALREAEAE